jgi:hypothetical protein
MIISRQVLMATVTGRISDIRDRRQQRQVRLRAFVLRRSH